MTADGSRVTGYRFGPFDLKPIDGTLERSGTRVRVQDLPYRLLLMLVERAGETVTREEVRQYLWPDNTFVEFDNSLGVAIRKVREALNDNAETPHYVATIPRRGYRFVAPVMVQVAEHPVPPAPQQIVPPAPVISAAPILNSRMDGGTPSRMPWGYWLFAGFVLLGGVTALSFRFHRKPPYVSPSGDSSVAAEVRLRRSVAILGFRNLPGRPEDAWLSPVFSEMLETELGTHGDLRMVSAEDVERIKHELPSTAGNTLSKPTLEHLRNNPGADVVILGSYTPMPGKNETRIRLDVRAQDTTDGETIAEEAITGDEGNLFDLAARAGSRLRQRLGLTPISAGDASAARVALPANERSARLYVDGRAKLWAFEFLSARDLLVQAVAADNKFPLAHSALSEAWWHLGYQTKARAEAQQARDLSQDLPQEDRLLIEGQYWRSMNDSRKAIGSYRTLSKMYPDNLDYGLLLATAEIPVQPSAALQTLATLRRLPAPLGNDARIDMTEASAWIGQDLVKARSAAQVAIEKGRAQGRDLLVSRTFDFLCQQGVGIGASTQEAIGDCERAMRMDKESGNRNAVAMMRTNLAGLRYAQGDVAVSESMFLTAIKEFREVGNADGVATTMSNLGAARLTRGDLTGARKLLENAIPQYQAIDDKDGAALGLSDLAELSRLEGKLDAAEADDRRAKATAEEIEDKSAVAYVLIGMGSILMDRGDLAGARQACEQSLAIRNQVGEKQFAGETQIALARIAIEDGRAAQVEDGVRRLMQQFHQEQQSDDELDAATVLTGALLAEGKRQEAQAQIEQGRALADKSQNVAERLAFHTMRARVLLSTGSAEQAAKQLAVVLKEARAHNLLGVELQARLVAAAAEKQLGHGPKAQMQLASLERAAHDRGFGLIARKAARP